MPLRLYTSLRFFLILILSWAAVSVQPARAEVELTETQYLEQALTSCKSEPVCVAHVRKLQARAAEKRSKEEQDQMLKERDPGAYYLTMLWRFLLFAFFVAAAAGGYVLVMHLLFKKKK